MMSTLVNIKGGDNKHPDCPPRMSDGRIFTDYRSRCDINYIQSQKGMDSYAYRQYLLQNADKIIDAFREAAYVPARCDVCPQGSDAGTMLSEKECDVCNARTCTRAEVDAAGIGLGRLADAKAEVLPWSPAGYSMLQ